MTQIRQEDQNASDIDEGSDGGGSPQAEDYVYVGE